MKKPILPKRLSRKSIYKSPWINLYADKVLMPSGKIIEKYHQLDYPKESVVILLLNAKGNICFVKSLRYTTQKVERELPAGYVEKGESILKAAEREVEEETGYKSNKLKLIYSFNPSIGMSNQIIHVVFGKISDRPQINLDADEIRDVEWLSEAEVKKLIKQKKIIDGISLISLLLYFY